ncbi:cytochrome P450 [Ktedonosporobacter rubrisoli]|uniref:Cytochrome P450 n=1 Tax=Ktedonosporobacter rubrisoli TaxID=2509675 RepID=A0A4P6K127_KTERU|nr:cytochrome P450 [Ktedonosporobacter rubrisoli]QBD81126.1 cytochrome P450 [Ktedonosporobacter rubrisoli]
MQGKQDTLEVYTPEFFLNPETLYVQLRASRPVCRVRLLNGTEGWWITHYEDVKAALKDSRLTKNPHSVLPASELEGIDADVRHLYSLITSHMLFSDPPNHTRLRSLVSKAFTPALIEQWHDRIQSITDALLDAVQPRGTMEVIHDFAFPLPITVISEMLGVVQEDREQFKAWSQVLVGNTSTLHALLPVISEAKAFLNYLFALIEQKRESPADDLISRLVQAEEAGDQLSADELVSMIFLLIIAGHETTTNFIGNAVLALLQHPDQMRALQEDPTLLQGAIEELLRYDTPVFSTTNRWAREDLEIGGQQIRRGELVLLQLASTNHDEQIFQDADTLDLRRQANQHLSFGKGIHYCLGAPLARLEGQIAISTLLRRMPNLRLAVDPHTLTRRPAILIHALEKLPVAF